MATFISGRLNARFKKPSPRLLAYGFYIAVVILATMAALTLISVEI